MKEQIKEYNTYKLAKALDRYVTPEFTGIKNIRLSQGTQGFEISANLIDDQDRSWSFNTKAISAGGYNIQIWHYRYIINLSSPEVPKNIVRQRVTEKERKEKDDRREERKKEHDERVRQKSAKQIASLFAEVKSKVKDWDEWAKDTTRDSVSRGHLKQDEFDRRENEVNRFKNFIQKYDYKRSTLTQKILDREITIADFNEIDDLMQPFYNYNYLKRTA
jgi:hypothetical protein